LEQQICSHAWCRYDINVLILCRYLNQGGARCSAYAAAHLHSLIYKHTHIDPLQSAHSSTTSKSKYHKDRQAHTPSKDGDQAIINGILEAFDELDKSWLSLATLYNYDDGSTAIVCLIHNRTLYVANVGDSRAVLVMNDGKAIEMSRDHKPSTESEKSRIEKLGGRIIYYGTWRVEGILAVTRSIGDRRLKRYVCSQPELDVRPIGEHDDFLILASDGVWDVISSDKCAEIVHSHSDSISSACMKITDQAYKLHSQDNITSMVIDLRQYR